LAIVDAHNDKKNLLQIIVVNEGLGSPDGAAVVVTRGLDDDVLQLGDYAYVTPVIRVRSKADPALDGVAGFLCGITSLRLQARQTQTVLVGPYHVDNRLPPVGPGSQWGRREGYDPIWV